MSSYWKLSSFSSIKSLICHNTHYHLPPTLWDGAGGMCKKKVSKKEWSLVKRCFFLFSITSSTWFIFLFPSSTLYLLALQFALFSSQFGSNQLVFCDLRGSAPCFPSSVWAECHPAALCWHSADANRDLVWLCVTMLPPVGDGSCSSAGGEEEKVSLKNFM